MQLIGDGKFMTNSVLLVDKESKGFEERILIVKLFRSGEQNAIFDK